MLQVLIENRDQLVITPSEILSNVKGITQQSDAEELADDVRDKLLAKYPNQREPWRQTYAEQLLDEDPRWLRPTRFPIEDTPVVWLGRSVLETGLYRVTQACRNQLRRDPNAAFSVSRRREPLLRDRDPDLEPFLLSGERADFRLPSYVAGYVPPGSIADREDSTAYNPGDSTALGDAKAGWIRHPGRGRLIFECTVAGTSDSPSPTFPDSLSEWAPQFTYSATQWVAPPTSLLIFEPTTPGISDPDLEPNWPTIAGQTVIDGTVVWAGRTTMEVTDGTVIWTGRTAREFPRGIRKAALLMARLIRRLDVDAPTCDDDKIKIQRVTDLLRGSC